MFHGGVTANLIVGTTSFGLNENRRGRRLRLPCGISVTQDFLAGFAITAP